MQLTRSEVTQWEHAYLDVFRRALFAAGSRRLILKSPTNLGRDTERTHTRSTRRLLKSWKENGASQLKSGVVNPQRMCNE